MALVLHFSGREPLGSYDGYDSTYLTVKGGEVMTWMAISTTSTDLATADIHNDGYVGTTSQVRPAATFASASTSRPLFLSDDGTLYYGTLFGAVVGGVAGQQANSPTVFTGAVLGPHTSTGSGKVTLWDKPGVYGTTLDAVDAASDGLVPTNASLTVGTSLTYTSKGLLTPVGSTNAVSGAPTVARLSSFETNGSLVTTPQNLVAALNSPSGSVTSLQTLKFYQAVYFFQGSL
jgi:hypothetical protein